MPRCPSCDRFVPPDRERGGARCPDCHDPLFEPPTRFARPAREEEATCAFHAGMESVGTCARCGSYLCETCRTRWRGQVWCAACVSRTLGTGERTPEQDRVQFRLALMSVALGVAAWVLSLLALLAAGMATAASGKGAVVLVVLAMGVLAFDVLLACVGVGQAVAALRTRGSHMILATVGLVVGGLYVGAMLGLGTFNIWQG